MGTQQMEIDTISKRKIELELSDADCERIYDLAGGAGLTVSALLENFIGDLVDGTYTNGSDERTHAQDWFNRCWFGIFPEETFLNHLLQNGLAKIVVEIWENKEYLEECIAASRPELSNINSNWDEIVHPDNTPCHASRQEWEDGEKECIKEYIEELEKCKGEISNYWEEYISQTGEKNRELDQEMEKVTHWWEGRQQFIEDTQTDGPAEERADMGKPEPTENTMTDEMSVKENSEKLNVGTSQNAPCMKHKSR